MKGLLVIVFYPSSHKYKLSLRKRDKRISSSVDCETDISALSLVYINELLRLGNYKPADRGRAQKKNVTLLFFSFLCLCCCETGRSSVFTNVRENDVYVRTYLYVYTRSYVSEFAYT